MTFLFGEKKIRLFLLAILLLATGLRVSLALVNRDAYDDHYRAIIFPMLRGIKPRSRLATIHPKFYHWLVVDLIKTLGIKNNEKRLLLAQFVNVAAGTATLILLLGLLAALSINSFSKVLAFLFVALNPGLIEINAMASNDSFAIFFSVACSLCVLHYFGHREVETPETEGIIDTGEPLPPFLSARHRPLSFSLILIFLTAAIGTKGNGLVLVIFLVLASCESTWKFRAGRHAKRFLFDALILSVLGFLSVFSFTGYFSHVAFRRLATSPTMVTGRYLGSRPPAVPVLSEAGKLTLSRAYLSFPFIDLFRNPVNQMREEGPYWDHSKYAFAHMHSYWSQVYGNMVSSRFHDSPRSWRPKNVNVLVVARSQMLLNLLPVFLFLFGMIGYLQRRKAWLSKPSPEFFGRHGEALLVILFFIFLLAGIRYYMIFPSFPFAKFIYIAPFLVSIVYFQARGLSALVSRRVKLATAITSCLLAVANVADILWLIYDLH